METFFRKYNWVIFLGLIGLGALLSALIANNFLASKLAPYTVPELPNLVNQEVDSGGAGDSKRADWSGMIGGRCLFGCVAPVAEAECPQGCAEGEDCQNGICVSTGESEELAEMSDVPVQSDLNVKLLGTMVAAQTRWSLALLFDNNTQQTHVLRVGQHLLGDAEILEITRDRVVFRRSGRLEFIRMENTLAGNPTAQPIRSAQPRSGRNPSAQVDGNVQRADPDAIKAAAAAESAVVKPTTTEGGVQQVSENKYTVPRATIEQQMANPESLARQARIMPNYKDGESAGLRLVGISPNSVYSQLGIRSGDVIHSVNGVSLDNQRQAMEMLDKMRSEKSVTIEVERRGKKEKIEYDIR